MRHTLTVGELRKNLSQYLDDSHIRPVYIKRGGEVFELRALDRDEIKEARQLEENKDVALEAFNREPVLSSRQATFDRNRAPLPKPGKK